MTIEEAISIVSGSAEGCVDEIMYDKALKMLLSSAEKQIPKKIQYSDDDDNHDWVLFAECPRCSAAVGRQTYCGECGQALDWSEE